MSNIVSGKTRYPSHSLGVFAQDPHLEIGATVPVWACCATAFEAVTDTAEAGLSG